METNMLNKKLKLQRDHSTYQHLRGFLMTQDWSYGTGDRTVLVKKGSFVLSNPDKTNTFLCYDNPGVRLLIPRHFLLRAKRQVRRDTFALARLGQAPANGKRRGQEV